MKDLCLISMFGGGGLSAAGFLVEAVAFSDRNVPLAVSGAECGGVTVFFLAALGHVGLTVAADRSRNRDDGD